MSAWVADLILVIHFLFIAFVVLGFLLIPIGHLRRWSWVRNFRFRIVHLLAIAVVVLQAWCNRVCPLTAWESRWRMLNGDEGYAGGFLQHWLHRLIFYDFPPWVFTCAYTLFGALVLYTWFRIPPYRSGRERPGRKRTTR
jgi:hypothetical protein